MNLNKLSVTMLAMVSFSISACGTEQTEVPLEPRTAESSSETVDNTFTPEEAAMAEETEIGETSQELSATCGHGTYAFASCNVFAQQVYYGCKARTTGRVVSLKRALCVPCKVAQGKWFSCNWIKFS